MQKVLIRLEKPGDMPFTNLIGNECWRKFYSPYFGKTNVEKVIAARKKRPHKFVPNSEKSFCFVALAGKQIVGYLVAGIKSRKGHIIALYVKPAFTERKIGTTLMNAALKRFGRKKLEKIVVGTHVKNLRAQAFYKRFGFVKKREKWFRTRGIKIRVIGMEKALQ